jgi:hypothetical protein
MSLLELISDPIVAFFGDIQDPDLAQLKALGLVKMVVAQKASWKATEAGREALKARKASRRMLCLLYAPEAF